jgi:hypothetical protein
MSQVIAIDYLEMSEAAPRVTELHLKLTAAAALVSGLDFGVEMPPAVKGRVVAQVEAARSDILQGANGVEGLGAELARRAHLAKLADTLDRVWMATKPLSTQLGAIKDLGDPAAQKFAGRALSGLGAAGHVLGIGWPTLADLRNPYLSTEQKIGRTAARGATTAVVGAGTKAATEAAVGRLTVMLGSRAAALAVAGGPIGVGVGVAWALLDYKLNISPKIAEGLTWTADKIGDGAQEFDDHVLDPAGDFAADRAADVANEVDKVTPWDGVSPF